METSVASGTGEESLAECENPSNKVLQKTPVRNPKCASLLLSPLPVYSARSSRARVAHEKIKDTEKVCKCEGATHQSNNGVAGEGDDSNINCGGGTSGAGWVAIGAEAGVGSKDWYARLREHCHLEDSEVVSSPTNDIVNHDDHENEGRKTTSAVE
ncbi:hypothetical protein DQ04_01591100 [Trypanosoma grayi]|uniref:hypothetical protein n=1 Tax=Trypanosoma grayi TaxID=71804 RepID=UPI0004F4307B|nr:hypothetical protein DQ04_01591100 [Trypanosoma grayi]KEG12601.1 hypothetical protein DQ04_01591100 [Trypanosoma grayi]